MQKAGLREKNKDNILDEALKSCKKVLWYTVIFGFVANIMMLALPIYSLQVLDRVISSGSIDTLLMLSIIALIAFVTMGLCQSARSYALIRMGEWLDKKLSSSFLSHSIFSSLMGKNSSGSQNLRDLNTLKTFLSGPTLSSIIDAPWSLIFITFIFLIHPINGFITLIGGLILLAIAILNEKLTSKVLKEANEHHVKSMHQAELATRNSEVIEAMGMMTNVVKRWTIDNNKGVSLQTIASDRAGLLSGISKVIRMVIQIVVIGVGSYLVLNDELTVGAIIAGSILVGRALAPFEASIASWKGVITARQSYNRLQSALENIPERPKSMQLPSPNGVVTMEGVYFTPPGMQKPTIRDINILVNPGEVVAVIGPSAAGKSTIAKLVTGVWKPLTGVVRLDGADTYTWDRDDFGKHVGYLPQDIELFNGTVKENIAKMDPNANPEEIVKAAKIAGVHELILRLPNGYETDIGMSGSVLSAGQRQRVGLARAFFGNPKLVILDEPNSNLDQDGEVALAKTIQYAKQAKITTLIISHRVQILSVVDKILVMQAGAVTGYGPKDEIMQKLNQNMQQNQNQNQSQNSQGDSNIKSNYD